MNLKDRENLTDIPQKSVRLTSDLILKQQSDLIQELQENLSRAVAELEEIRKTGRPEDAERIKRLMSENDTLKEENTLFRSQVKHLDTVNRSLKRKIVNVIENSYESEVGRCRAEKRLGLVVVSVVVISIMVISL